MHLQPDALRGVDQPQPGTTVLQLHRDLWRPGPVHRQSTVHGPCGLRYWGRVSVWVRLPGEWLRRRADLREDLRLTLESLDDGRGNFPRPSCSCVPAISPARRRARAGVIAGNGAMVMTAVCRHGGRRHFRRVSSAVERPRHVLGENKVSRLRSRHERFPDGSGFLPSAVLPLLARRRPGRHGRASSPVGGRVPRGPSGPGRGAARKMPCLTARTGTATKGGCHAGGSSQRRPGSA